MPTGLVEQHPSETVGEHHRHATAGAGAESSMMRAFWAARRRQRGNGHLLEVVQTLLHGERLSSHLEKCSPLGHDAHRHHLANTFVGVPQTIGVRDPYPLPRLAVYRHDLADLPRKRAGRLVGQPEQTCVCRHSCPCGGILARRWGPQAGWGSCHATTRDRPGGTGVRASQFLSETDERRLVNGVHVSELGGHAAHDPDGTTPIYPRHSLLDLAILEAQRK